MKKKTKIYLLTMISVLFMAACSKDKTDTDHMTNYIELNVSGDSFIREDAKEGIKVTAQLAFAPDRDVTADLALTGNDGDIVHLNQNTLTFKAGEKQAIFYVLSNNKHALSAPKVITIKVKQCSDLTVKPFNDGVKVTIKPASDIPELTQEQLKLIDGYKQKYGFDLSRLLGQVTVETTIIFNTKDREEFFKGMNKLILKGKTIITLSEKATAETPVLKMTDNPMGMTSFLYEIFRKITVEDNEFFLQQPYPKVAVKASQYNRDTDTFSAILDDITLVPSDKSVIFTGPGKKLYDEPITTVPFVFDFSAWNRLKAMADSGQEVIVVENGKEVGYKLADIIAQGGSLDPAIYLIYSTIDKDDWGNNPSDWVKPTASYDFEKGVVFFTFPWDFERGNGYEQVHVTYTMHEK